MTFREWYENHPLWDVRLPVVETWLAQCWDAATRAERERCARVAEQAGWDTQQERAHGKYVAERIRDGDKPL